MTERTNIILVCVDQMRGDAMSGAGHPVVQTPYLDTLAAEGTTFPHAYSAVPTCVPARVGLMTGLNQESHGRYGYREGVPFSDLYETTLPRELGRAGYQTQAIGKMHVYPERDRIGFDDVRLHDGFLHFARQRAGRNLQLIDDYSTWLRRQPGMAAAAETDHGVGCNSMMARPWDKDEAYHPTSWIMSEAVDWLHRRDPTMPFFLYLSFHRPHAPYDPPAWALDQYLDADLGEAPVGDWVDRFADYRRDHLADASFGKQRPEVRRRALAGYFGLITQIDHQLNRMFEALSDFDLLRNTAIMFVSDHGDMLGDHHFYRKSVGYEGSARIPFILRLPGGEKVVPSVDEVVELRDVMPTILDIAGAEIPDSLDGASVLPLIRGEEVSWREEIHGEHTYSMQGWESMHWVTDGHRKFVWWSGSGIQQFFDLDADPTELQDLAHDAARADELGHWRQRLIRYLSEREEGFVVDGELVVGREVRSEASWVEERVRL
ncbi:arylsulfatase [Tessaracoccus sp. ZS01]|uniref:arylsulfatase n=1 Tax=Tessaracoccus sp. ZS01 TaxID=1906324 RepID=UPI00096C3057|nr:arylsulfatase [Tessaracoccus sp. ZS01]MCG6567239.1 arylsulfatase [Tessaracoccus sp. ZS01]OMG57204.1 arylsulfatase [Tessaracoccus sp. ZS01]